MRSREAIKVILCDVDGVIVNKGDFKAVLELQEKITPAMTRSFFTNDLVECQLGRADIRERLAHVLPGWGWSPTVDAFLDLWFRSDSKVDQRMLCRIQEYRNKGVRCFLTTMQERHRMHYLLHVLNLSFYFDGAFPSYAIGRPKNSPEFYREIIRLLSLETAPSEILLIDDCGANIQAAEEAGISAKLFTTTNDFLGDEE